MQRAPPPKDPDVLSEADCENGALNGGNWGGVARRVAAHRRLMMPEIGRYVANRV